MADQGATVAVAATERHHEHKLTPLADPGKQDRSAHGIPVVPEFDGYRAFAIFAIMGSHVILSAGLITGTEGDRGDKLIAAFGPWLVSILFIISGFVVFLPTVARDGEFGSVGGYAIRRAARLLPAYWITMLIVLILILIAAGPTRPFPGLSETIVTLAGQGTWATIFHSGSQLGFGIDPPVWTLTLEIGFYILLPLIASAYCRRPLLGLAIAAAISVGWRLGFANLEEITGIFGLDVSADRAAELNFAATDQLPAWAYAFGAGMTAAWAYVNLPRRFSAEAVARAARPALAASIAAIAVCAYFSRLHAVGNDPIQAALAAERDIPLSLAYIGAIAAAMVALSLSRLRSPFRSTFARRLGDISYGVFLIHAVFMWILFWWIGAPFDGSARALVIWVVGVVPLSVAYGYVSARFVEQPIRRWARRFGRRAQEQAPATPKARSAATAPRASEAVRAAEVDA